MLVQTIGREGSRADAVSFVASWGLRVCEKTYELSPFTMLPVLTWDGFFKELTR